MTMRDRKDMDEAGLEALFETARADAPPVPRALMDRVLADAQAAQPAAQAGPARGLLAMLGGLPALGGLITATCVGFWIGVAPPEALPDLGALVLGSETQLESDTFGFGWDIEEG